MFLPKNKNYKLYRVPELFWHNIYVYTVLIDLIELNVI